MSTIPGEPFTTEHATAVRMRLAELFPTAEIATFHWYGEEVRASVIFPDGTRLATALTRGRQDAPTPEATAHRLSDYFKAKSP